MIELLERLRERDARSVRIACTHGLFSAGALDRLDRRHDVLEIVSTNTVPIPAEKWVPKLKILSVAPALAEAMRRIHNGNPLAPCFTLLMVTGRLVSNPIGRSRRLGGNEALPGRKDQRCSSFTPTIWRIAGPGRWRSAGWRRVG